MSVLCFSFHLWIYAVDGLGAAVLQYISKFLETVTSLLLSVILFVLAEGTGVYKATVATESRLATGAAKVFAGAFLLFFMWEELRYRAVYISRLALGDRFGGYGLSPYCALFGSHIGVATLIVRACIGGE
eukprot:Protomagalhaensia_wolfi_Nauph_80__3551@NODE_359_length_2681_cov_815_162377_g270_i0_p2_GENE_NODE_359_length_2681_cov_815_162377_g270_i0NODE_359_length_2681_cov_815_162377_g270_i0_p2_ORF_typecomplete_len130_score29_44GpcrRhopsn4/PF10192_9/4_1e08DUF4134/PF13572_6/0_066SLATT_3/PF18184_1/1_6_NODE_359_length_2681_cov_815_162377_g270_i021882577